MNSMARKFYQTQSDASFDSVLFLCETKGVEWTALSERVPDLPRAWFELSQIQSEERIEFMRDFWIDLLPYHPVSHEGIVDFFSELEDISIVIAKQKEDYFPHLVYSLKDNRSFFSAYPPASEEDVREFRFEIKEFLPRDYLSFLKIHNGMGRRGEAGILRMEEIRAAKKKVAEIVTHPHRYVKYRDQIVDPNSLIPFFEVAGLNSFQCFFSEWCPGNEMGNVYLSGIDYTISDTRDRCEWAENLAFTTFLQWLVQYLEGVN